MKAWTLFNILKIIPCMYQVTASPFIWGNIVAVVLSNVQPSFVQAKLFQGDHLEH